VKEFSEFVCQYKCEKEPDCVGYLAKAPGCTSSMQDTDDGDGIFCQLLYGLCEEDKSQDFACWDISLKAVHKDDSDSEGPLFYLQGEHKQGGNELSVTNATCFRAGDTIELFHETEDFKHQYAIMTVDPITITPPLTHTYHQGTGVLRIHYPYSAAYCGDFPKG